MTLRCSVSRSRACLSCWAFCPSALLARLRRLFVEELRQILKLRHDLHAAFLAPVGRAGERMRAFGQRITSWIVVLALLIVNWACASCCSIRSSRCVQSCSCASADALAAKTSALLASSAVRKLRICIVRFPSLERQRRCLARSWWASQRCVPAKVPTSGGMTVAMTDRFWTAATHEATAPAGRWVCARAIAGQARVVRLDAASDMPAPPGTRIRWSDPPEPAARPRWSSRRRHARRS